MARGRPIKMTPERQEAVLGALRRSLTRSDAANLAGISRETLRRWTERDPQFAAAVEAAEAEARSMLVNLVISAALKRLPNTWQAAAWLLERRWPELYGLRGRLEVSIELNAEAQRIAAASGLDPDKLIAEAEAILAGLTPKSGPKEPGKP